MAIAQNVDASQVGPAYTLDGISTSVRSGRNGELVVTDAHGVFHEPASRGAIFIASNAVAGVAPGTALSTTPPIALYNPTGSGYGLSITKLTMGYVSGTMGAGTVVGAYYNAQPSAPTGGTALVPVCANMTARTAKIGKAYTGSTVAGTPVIVRPVFNLSASLASTAGGFNSSASERIDGEVVVMPGTVFVLQAVAAAGSTPLVIFSVAWEEVQLSTVELTATT